MLLTKELVFRYWSLLTTNKIPCIYLQNSGLDATDPLTNLCHKYVYGTFNSINRLARKPFLKDEPQHIIQGSTICKTLKNYKIPYYDTNKISLKKYQILLI